MSPPSQKLPLDGKKFTSRLQELEKQDRTPRCVDVLLQHQAEIVSAIKAGVQAKEIHAALLDSGYKISYPGFMRSMVEFRALVQLPNRRDLIRQQRLLARSRPGAIVPSPAPAPAVRSAPASPPPAAAKGEKADMKRLLGPGIKGVVSA